MRKEKEAPASIRYRCFGHNTSDRTSRHFFNKQPCKYESNDRLYPTPCDRLSTRHRSGIQSPSGGQFEQPSLP